jgi:predicted metal-binding membrane protein
MADTGRASEGEGADGGGPSKANEDAHQIAARIAQAFRDAGVSAEVLDPAPTEIAFGTLIQRDRTLVGLALTLLIALTWSYLLWLSVDMGMAGMDMPGFRMIPAGMGLMMPEHEPWRTMEFALVFAMWTVMMVAMMTPSAMPMIFMYARVGRHAQTQHTPLVATAWFVAGYFLVWIAFALLATLAQWALEPNALLDSAMTRTSNVLGGLMLVAAGSYQWTRLKDICLTQCRVPLAFLMRRGGFHRDLPGCLLLGLRHGAYCVGCCWALMALLLGVTNLLWMILLSSLVFLEKFTSMGRQIAALAGIVLVVAGAWLLGTG